MLRSGRPNISSNDHLPPTTSLPSAPIGRRHAPSSTDYTDYRACLRWEFGFSCAFCWLHEADLDSGGIEGTGLFGIEHHLSQSADPSRAAAYDNCFLACRFCNGARATRPAVGPDGRRLLHPCATAWAGHFVLGEDRLRARDGDRDAEYTHEAYDLDDPRKVACRRERRERIDEAVHVLHRGLDLERDLLRRAASTPEPAKLIEAARILSGLRQRAVTTLSSFPGIPLDAPVACACGQPPALPAFFERQLRTHGAEPSGPVSAT
jgi:hypothetical protein